MISLCMIVRDEAARLPACLASAAGTADEFVVVDTGSTDDTPAIARAHGARVVSWLWRDDFAAARNESLRHAAGDWVLVLDADERLAPASAARIRALTAAAQADGFDCRLVSALPPDQPAAVIAHWYCRLFRRAEGVRFEGRVHEQVAPSIHARGGRIVRSDVTILHEGYARPSPAKLDRNLRLLRRMLAARPEDAFALMNLGLTLASMGDRAGAEDAFEQAIASPVNRLSRELRAVAWAKLAELRLSRGAWALAAEAAERALGLAPDLALARYTLGRALFEQGASRAAGLLFDELADAPPDTLGMRLNPRLVALAQAVVRLRERRWEEAAEVLEPHAADDPSGEAAFHLGNAYLGLRRLGEARTAYEMARGRGFRDPNLPRRLALCRELSERLEVAGAAAGASE